MKEAAYYEITCKQCKGTHHVKGWKLKRLKLCALCKRHPGRTPEEMAALREWIDKYYPLQFENKVLGTKHVVPRKPF